MCTTFLKSSVGRKLSLLWKCLFCIVSESSNSYAAMSYIIPLSEELSLGDRLPFVPFEFFFLIFFWGQCFPCGKFCVVYSKHTTIAIPLVHMEMVFFCRGKRDNKPTNNFLGSCATHCKWWESKWLGKGKVTLDKGLWKASERKWRIFGLRPEASQTYRHREE